MTKVSVNGISFNCADGEPADFGYFCEGHVKANDTGVMGMVQEMKAFIRVQDKLKLRNFVDVGALFGVFSLVFTSRYQDTRALAIEPSPPAFDGLSKNVMLNPECKILVLECFCSAKTGDKVQVGKDWKHIVANTFLDRPGAEMITGMAIDDIAGAQSCDCMKIDVEGFECSVLHGARKTIERLRPVIFLEAHLQSLTPAGETPAGLYALLGELGYNVCMLDDSPLPSFNGYSHARVICYPK